MMFEGLRNLGGNPFLRNQLTLAFTGPRLGLGFFLVGATLTIVQLSLYAESAMYRGQTNTQTASIMAFAHHAALLGLLLVLLPIKAAGSLEGPRLSGVFDQLVGTGINPPIIALGGWASGMLYGGMILTVSLPFAVCLHLLVDVPIGALAFNYGVLLLYCNVILAASLAASTLFREYSAVPATIALFAACGVMSVVPEQEMFHGLPSVFAELMPVRWFFAQNFAPEEFGRLRVDYNADPVLFFWAVPLDAFRLGLWLLLIAISVVIIKIGPGHRFSKGLNSFGTVTTSSRFASLVRRLKSGLTRRVELAFFYENAPAWTHRWGFVIRHALIVLPLVVLWAIFVGSAYLGHPYPVDKDVWDDELLLGCCIITAVPLVLWSLWVCDGKATRRLPVSIGHRTISRERFLFAMASGLFAAWFLLVWCIRDQLLANAAIPAPPTRNPNGLTINLFDQDRYKLAMPLTAADLRLYAQCSWRLILLISCLVVNTFLITRVTARSVKVAQGLALFLVTALYLGPLVTGGLIRAEFIAPAFEPITYLTPAYLATGFNANGGTEAMRTSKFLLAHGILTIALLLPMVIGAMRNRMARRALATAATALLATILSSADAVAAHRAEHDRQDPAVQDPAGQDPAGQDPATRPSPLVIEFASRGFEGVVFGQTDFFTVVIRNDAETPIKGDYWFETRYLTIQRRPFFLSGKSRKTIRFLQAEGSDWWQGLSGPVVFRFGDRRVESKELHRVIQPGIRGKNPKGQQHVFVGDRTFDLPPQLLRTMLGNNASNAVFCAARNLPTQASSYIGLEGLWLTTKALSTMQPNQRTALYRYVLLGGTVMFHGGLIGDQIPQSGPWAAVLADASSRVLSLDGTELRHVALHEGQDTLWATTPNGTDLPILNLRTIGTGTIGHAAFFPHVAETPKSLVSSGKFWQRYVTSLRRGHYPSRISYADTTPLSNDWSSMALLGVYLGGYSLLLGVALLFTGRRRRQTGAARRARRRPVLVWVMLPLLFSAGIPLLVAAIRSSTTAAQYFELTWFGPHSTRGVVTGQLNLRSGGKRYHEIDFHDPGVVAEQRTRYPNLLGHEFVDQLANASGGSKEPSKLRFNVPAWSRTGIRVSAPRYLDQPIDGSATRVSTNVISAQGTIPEEVRGLRAWCTWYDPIRGSKSQLLILDESGRFEVRLERTPPKKAQKKPRQQAWSRSRNNGLVLPGHQMGVHDTSRRARVMVVLAVDTKRHRPGLDITSPDLDFSFALPIQQPVYKSYRMLPKVERAGRRFALRVRRCIVYELPLR